MHIYNVHNYIIYNNLLLLYYIKIGTCTQYTYTYLKGAFLYPTALSRQDTIVVCVCGWEKGCQTERRLKWIPLLIVRDTGVEYVFLPTN